MSALRPRILAAPLVLALAFLPALACSASSGDATDSSRSALGAIPIGIPIHLPLPTYSGPSYTPSTVGFGLVEAGARYEKTLWFTIAQDDNFTAQIENSYGGVVQITNMQAWWNAWGCTVNSPLPNCFAQSISGPGALGVEPAEVVGVTVSLDPSSSNIESISTQLVTSGSDWTESIPVTADITKYGPNPAVVGSVLPDGPLTACPQDAAVNGDTVPYFFKGQFTNVGGAAATYTVQGGTADVNCGWGSYPGCSGTLAAGASVTFEGFQFVPGDATPGATETATLGFAWGVNGTNSHSTMVSVNATVLSCDVPGPTTPCGASGQGCCTNSICDSGLACESGSCKPAPPACGGQDQSCCGGSGCDSAFTCQNGLCELPCNVPCYENCGYGCSLEGDYCSTMLPTSFGEDDCPVCCGASCLSSDACQ